MNKKRLLGFLLTLIIFILLYFALKDFAFFQVYRLLKEINLFYFFVAFFMYLIFFLLWNARAKSCLKKVVKGSYGFFLVVLFSGCFFNTITPGASIGGEPVRAYFLGKKYKKSKSKILGAIIADKLINLFTYIAFILISILFVLVFIKISSVLKIILESLLIVVMVSTSLIIYFVFSKKRILIESFLRKLHQIDFVRKRFRSFHKFFEYFNTKLINIVYTIRKVISDKKQFFHGIIFSLLCWTSIYSVAYCLFLAFGFRINIFSVIIVITLGQAIGDLSPSPGGIGIAESSMFLLYSAMGVPGSLAILVTLLDRAINYFFQIFVGGLCFLYLKIKID